MVIGGQGGARWLSEVCISLEYKYQNQLHKVFYYTTDITQTSPSDHGAILKSLGPFCLYHVTKGRLIQFLRSSLKIESKPNEPHPHSPPQSPTPFKAIIVVITIKITFSKEGQPCGIMWQVNTRTHFFRDLRIVCSWLSQLLSHSWTQGHVMDIVTMSCPGRTVLNKNGALPF